MGEQDRYRDLVRVVRNPNPFTPQNLSYSRRWMGFGALAAAFAGRMAWRRRWRVIGALGASGAGLAGMALAGRSRLEVTEQTYALGRGNTTVKIAHLSDLHYGPGATKMLLRTAIGHIAAARPDMIVVTGDVVDSSEDLEEVCAELAALVALRPPLGLWACLGNHDFWSDPQAVVMALEQLGINVLLNEHAVVETAGGPLVVGGVLDAWCGRADIGGALAGAPAGVPSVLLSHCPDYIDEAAQHGVSLQLSGHTHAGHIDLPLLGPIVLPRHGERYYRGRYRIGGSWLYVQRGLGGLPLRLGAHPELAMHTLLL